MLLQDNNTQAFLALVRAGLWEADVQLLEFEPIDYSRVLSLAEVQSVVGLVTAGLEHVADIRVPQGNILQFIGQSLLLEQRNRGMDYFIAEITRKMNDSGIDTLLVKGQGIAQCYERPLWRASGDVDFLLDTNNYRKAIDYLLPLSSNRKNEERYSSHLGISIDPWYVEVHGSLRTGLSAKVDKIVDEVHEDTFKNRKVRVWKDGDTNVLLPEVNNDVFFVFTHFIKHFYKEGMSLRQICDWCRLLWTYRDMVDVRLLESRIRRAGLMDEWRAFAALAVDYLGMSVAAMPLYSIDKKWHLKGERILNYILNKNGTGKIGQTLHIAKIFPRNTIKFSPAIFFHLNWLKIKERVFGT